MPTRAPPLLGLLCSIACLSVSACISGAVDRQCFRNEYPFPDEPGTADVVDLSVMLEGARVTGVYRWLPAFKDRRVGTLEGSVRNDTIAATYTFSQEGSNQSAEITIVLEQLRAVARGGLPALGLGADIARVACSN